MPDNTNKLIVNNLCISYRKDSAPAVDNLSFEARGGEVLGVLGGNGAGKTSTLKALAGVTPANSGEIVLGEYNYSRSSDVDAARGVLGYAPDIGGLIKQATTVEHIDLVRGLRPDFPYSKLQVDELIELMGLSLSKHESVGGFSHGMARRLSVLLGFLSARSLLILDEPFDGVDPLGVESTINLINRAKTDGLIIIISTHLLSLLTSVSDQILVMNRGHSLQYSSVDAFLGENGVARYRTLLVEDSSKK